MTRRTYGLVVGAVLAGEAVLLAWNATQFDWLRGYDAFANDRYAEIAWSERRLPDAAETGVWHSPPLWFVAAGALRSLSATLGAEDLQLAGQLLAAAAGFAICVLVLLVARALWPERRALHVVALVVVAASPALVRASAMYHPETLAVALSGAAVLVAVRGLGGRPTLATGAVAGALVGLAALTRAWALPVLVAIALVLALDARSRRSWAAPLALLVVSGAIVAPWLVNQQRAHGSALAFNRDAPAGSLLSRRSASFYLGPRLLRAFQEPVTPVERNELVPQLYADWWGDWALTWKTPPPPKPGELHAAGVVPARIRQLYVGIAATLLALAGLVALTMLAVSRRAPRLALLPLVAAGTGVAYLLFAVRYPSTDGDVIKGTYLLTALPSAAVASAFALDALRPRGRAWNLVLAGALTVFVAVQLPFLVL